MVKQPPAQKTARARCCCAPNAFDDADSEAHDALDGGLGEDRGNDAKSADVREDAEVADHEGGQDERGGGTHEARATDAKTGRGEGGGVGEHLAEVLALDDELNAAVAEGLEEEERADAEPPPLRERRQDEGG